AREGEEPPLLGALGSGHSYLSFGLLADATGFRFHAERNGLVGIMGDRISGAADLTLILESPLEGRISLYRDGAKVRETTARRLAFPGAETGVYRGEVSLPLHGKTFPWIISNPIYVV